MATTKQDYAAMVSQLLPGQAVEVLNDRMREVGKLNTTIADWLQERRRIEEQYSAGLRRLARKQLEDVDLGVFSIPWSAIANSAETLADSHAALASKIEVDVERPLRVFTTSSREFQGMTTIQGNLVFLAKDVDHTRAKFDRLKNKGADGNKISEAERELSNANAQWESQAPYVFEHLQTADEARLSHLRDVLTQFQTHEVDQVEKDRASAEHCLNILLQVETADEIKTYVLKTLSNAPGTGSVRPSLSTPMRPSSSNHLTPSRSQAEDDAERANSLHEDKRKSRFGGLKRLGTVVGKRDSKKRESKLPASLSGTSEPSEKSAKPFNALAGRFGRNKDAPSLEPPREEEQEHDTLTTARPPSSIAIDERTRNGHAVRDTVQPPSLPVQQPNNDIRASYLSQQASHGPNGATSLEAQKPIEAVEPSTASTEPINLAPPPQASERTGYTLEDNFAPSNDISAPAFNVNIRDAPVQENNSRESDAALASVAGRLQAPPVASRSSTIRGRRAARNSTIPSAYFAPEEGEAPAPEPTSAPVASEAAPVTAVQQPPTVDPPVATASERTLSDNREVATAGAAASPSATVLPAAAPIAALAPQSPSQVPRPASRAAILPQHTGDNNSIRSGTSVASQILRHGELNEIGLNSSILETINARFENGKLVSSSLLGEVALAYTPADFSSPFGTETIRLSNFSQLERVAPNPAFINQTSSGTEGEYTVNLAGISRPQVAFRYQVRSPDVATCAPLVITTASKIESTQASVIVSYSLNPAFDIGQNTSISLTNVMLGLSLEGAVATGCQSRPVGTFSRERSFIFWQLGDITLSPGSAPVKLLARFVTESQATGAGVEARWEAFGIGSGLTINTHSHGDQTDSTDPFADESAAATSSWKPTKGPKKITSGQYVAR